MSIDNASPEDWDTIFNNLSIRKKADPVDRPDHYNKRAVEAIEAIKASMPEHERIEAPLCRNQRQLDTSVSQNR